MGLAGDGVPVAQDRYLNIGLGYILQGWVSSIRYDSGFFFYSLFIYVIFYCFTFFTVWVIYSIQHTIKSSLHHPL